MTELTAAQTTLLRTRPHNTKLWLSIYKPRTVLSAQVNNLGAGKGDRTIIYDGATGDYTQIKSGMTLYVGTAAGLMDKGRIRVRSATGSTLVVAENSDISWENDDFLTIVDFHEINAVYPRIIQDPAHPLRTIWYKDYDIAYTNQNSVLGSFICMGGHYAGFIGEDGKAWVYFSSSGTESLLGSDLSYAWDFSSGTPQSSSGTSMADPGWVTFSDPGHYTVSLGVSGTAGESDISYRHISIYDRPENGTSTPILNWELVDLSGDREGGGYTATIRLHENVPNQVIRDGALVVIFADDWYNGTKTSIGGNQENRESIVFSGYILNGSIKYNYAYSAIEFEVGSPTIVMQDAETFSVSITYSSNPLTEWSNNKKKIPSPWCLVKDLGVARGVYHYLRWHSTVLECTDIHYLAPDRAIYAEDFDRTSLYDAVNTLINGALLGRCVSDRQGSIWFEREIYVDPDAYATGTNYYLTKQDWMDEPQIEERQTGEISYLEIGGVVFSGAITTSTPLLCGAPGAAPAYRGGVERIQGLALLNQTELNTLGGYYFRYRNVRYPDLQFKLSGNYRNADIAPQEKWHVLINTEDTVRQIGVDVESFIKNVSFSYEPKLEALSTQVGFCELSTLLIGDTIVIPEEPPEPHENPTGTTPPPPANPPTGTASTGTYYALAYVAANGPGTGSTYGGIYYTSSFSASSGVNPTWQHLATDDNITFFIVDERDPANYAYYRRSENGGTICDRNGNVLLDRNDACTNIMGESTEDYTLTALTIDQSTGLVYVFMNGSSGHKSYILVSSNHGASWAIFNSQVPFYGGTSYMAVRGICIWVTYTSLFYNFLKCSPDAGATWKQSPSLGPNGAAPLWLDPFDPFTCWTAGTQGVLKKVVYSGGSITSTVKSFAPLGGGVTQVDHLWIDPSDSSHQRVGGLTSSYLWETEDEWGSFSATGTTPSMGADGQICQQRWSWDYSWYAVIRSDVNRVYVYASEAIDGGYFVKNGANYNTPPYTDSIPELANGNPYFSFWAGNG